MESEFIEWLRDRLPRDPHLLIGPGDDAAVWQLASGALVVVTSDMLTDGVDFHLSQCDPQKIGRKALAVNLSDLAAMAAKPSAAVVSLVLPRVAGSQLARQIYKGLLSLADQFQTVVAGGDTNTWDGPLAINVTAWGELPGEPLLRSGAQPGDDILVTGCFGGSILGKHFDFQPRVAESLTLAAEYELHAGTDVSDGLSLDLAHIARESHCGAVLNLDAVPISAAAVELAAVRGDGVTPLDHALSDGEDFELVLAVPPDTARRLLDLQPLGVPLTRIGQFVAQPGLWTRAPDGMLRPLEPRGYEHRLLE